MSVAMRRLNENITQLIKVKWIPIIYFVFVFTAAARIVPLNGDVENVEANLSALHPFSVRYVRKHSDQKQACPDIVPECTNKLLYCTGHKSINVVIGDRGTHGRCSCVRHEQYILWHNFFFNFCQDLENFQKLNFDS